ncbi:MAG: HAMP domain-containing histidine kinase [Bacteroidales bacterium]|nr:HAMP domain-containing histidine kinase [Bacteroidales bacterium]
MKKSTIWILTFLMAVAFVGLICMQMLYLHNMVNMRYEQFSEGVRQSLYAVSQRLVRQETRYFLDESVSQVSSSSIYSSNLSGTAATPQLDGLKFSFTSSTGLEADLTIKGDPSQINRIQSSNGHVGRQQYQSVRDEVRDRYRQQKGIIDEVIVNIIAQSSVRPINERADSATVSSFLREELDTLGLKVPFEFAVVNRSGTVLYRTAGYSATSAERDNMFVQVLFPNDPLDKQTYLKVYFPTKNDYVFSSVSFMYPSIAFTAILLVVFVITIVLAFRQKKLSEMKNDFINNMTHEFKTPISSISLAAQMLNDQSVRKSPTMLQQISTVINDETKRLRFQVEKVLQMSMFDRQKATLKLEEVDANLAIYNIVNTFKLKVEKYGGKITAQLDAMDAIVNVDEMHFTNVIFNLLDNAVKYRDDERPLNLLVTSRDLPDERLEITVQDNGIGIRKDDLKKIFEKFYRVSTGNLHDVKGFGLGLAYVHKMVHELGGEITVESELHVGTKFIIILPLSKN